MAVGAVVTRSVVLAAIVACGHEDRPSGAATLEQAIARDLGQRLHLAVHARCFRFGPACSAHLPDGTALPIALARRGGAWEWRVVGLVVTTEQLEAYLRAEIAELGSPQEVTCAPRIRRLAPDDRIACALGGGGTAFVTVRADGSTSVEVALDPAAATARSEAPRDEVLSATSTALEHDRDEDGEDDAEGAAPPAGSGDPR